MSRCRCWGAACNTTDWGRGSHVRGIPCGLLTSRMGPLTVTPYGRVYLTWDAEYVREIPIPEESHQPQHHQDHSLGRGNPVPQRCKGGLPRGFIWHRKNNIQPFTPIYFPSRGAGLYHLWSSTATCCSVCICDAPLRRYCFFSNESSFPTGPPARVQQPKWGKLSRKESRLRAPIRAMWVTHVGSPSPIGSGAAASGQIGNRVKV